MNKALYQWALCFLLAIIISAFLHEVGHGIAAYLQGIPVSTGFNRVGDINRTPGDEDFRKEFDQRKNGAEGGFKWDLGPVFTLTLAIIFTFALHKVSNKHLVLIIGAMAFANAFLRLIPMIIAYGSLLFSGSLYIEDELSTGLRWYQMTGISILKYLPSLISVIVSVVCYKFTIKELVRKMPALFNQRRYFLYVVIITYLLSLPILNFLDTYLRINWG